MNPPEAREIIAGYLSGLRRIPFEELERACSVLETAGRADGTLREFRHDLGLTRRDLSVCDVFGGRAAEFADLPRAARERLFPELTKHVEACRPCRRVLWDLKPLWEIVTTAARARCHVLTEPIRLALSRKGTVEERGSGFPSLGAVMAVACAAEMTLHAPEELAVPPGSRRKEWLLKDDEAECSVRLIVEVSDSAQATLRCVLESATDAAPRPDQVRIEIRRARNNSLFLAGPLSNFQADPIVLALDAWVIKLIPNDAQRIPSWEIPLQLEPNEETEDD
ncbi:MAG: hypothetical protein L0Y58_03090 [Verrucomicrobia subdivision 3 bacterium]|nr:hypothetical protein [Limisphaerales bacterium]